LRHHDAAGITPDERAYLVATNEGLTAAAILAILGCCLYFFDFDLLA